MKNVFLTIFFLIGLVFVVSDSFSQEVDYTLYGEVLENYVNENGRVNYEELKKNIENLEDFIDQVENAEISNFSEVEVKAFWINAYNAITLKVVTDKYPVKGIRRINFGLVWEVPRKVAKNKHGLGYIEHQIVRPMGDPRIHFALNCASIGCPKLPTRPFYPLTLDQQLNNETVRFINDPKKVRLDRETNTLYYSAIFDWFEEDFLLVSPSVLEYIKKYINEKDLRYINENDVKLEVLKYDWGLNDVKTE